MESYMLEGSPCQEESQKAGILTEQNSPLPRWRREIDGEENLLRRKQKRVKRAKVF